MHYYEKQSALASLASALQAAGWTLYQFHPPVCNPVGDYEPARWYGHAEHKHFPGLKLVSANFSPTFGNYEGHPRTSTPRGCMWHIEQHGQVVAQGKGLRDCRLQQQAPTTTRKSSLPSPQPAAKLTAPQPPPKPQRSRPAASPPTPPPRWPSLRTATGSG